MRFTLGFLPRDTVAYGLLALALLTAHSQDALAPEIHGIVVANMDRSANAGADGTDPNSNSESGDRGRAALGIGGWPILNSAFVAIG
jgi:hypothetical protein